MNHNQEPDSLEVDVRLNALLDAIPDGVVVVDADGIIERSNNQLEAIFLCKKDELVGSPIDTLIPARFRPAHTLHRASFVRTPRVRYMGEGLELFGLRRDGTEFPIGVALSPIRTDQGLKVVASIRDISAQRANEARIQELNIRLAALFNDAPDGVIVADAGGRVARVNAQTEALFGYDRAELLGRPIEVLLPARLRKLHVAHRVRFGNEPKRRPMGAGTRLFGLRKDGTEFPISVSLSPTTTEDGEQVIASVRDISEQVESERRISDLNQTLTKENRKLAIMNEELEAFSASVSHDLRSPLRAIDGFSKAILEDHTDVLDDQAKAYFGRIRAAAQRMGFLIDDLLKLSRITRTEFWETDVDLTEIAQGVSDEIGRAEPDRTFEFLIQNDMMVRGDPRLLRIALENLMLNAVKFTKRAPVAKIVVGEERSNGKNTYFVRDNGVGFDMKYLDELFRPFKRLHDSREFIGTGVGLATVKRVIQKHGGSIWAEARPNEGACFLFTLRDEQSQEA